MDLFRKTDWKERFAIQDVTKTTRDRLMQERRSRVVTARRARGLSAWKNVDVNKKKIS
jgi:hypothetical protein